MHINENFAKLAEALYIADRKAREAVEMRSQIEKKLAQKEKEKKEQNLRDLAQKAREERAGIHRPAAAATATSTGTAAAAATDKDGLYPIMFVPNHPHNHKSEPIRFPCHLQLPYPSHELICILPYAILHQLQGFCSRKQNDN